MRAFRWLLGVVTVLGIATPAAAIPDGAISGTVTGDAGIPLAQVCVSALNPDGDWYGDAYTGRDGTYRISGLPSGRYKVSFVDCADRREYASEWYDDRADFDSADPIAVGSSEVAGIDAQLARGGVITGTISDQESGAPLGGICVEVQSADESFDGWAYSGRDGGYRVGGLRTGEYRVHFMDCEQATYLHEWYDDQADFASATPVPVTQGTETPGIDAALQRGGVISGYVTDEATGDPLGDICVEAVSDDGNYSGFGFTDPDGAYRAGGLGTGLYRVQFIDCGYVVPEPGPPPVPSPVPAPQDHPGRGRYASEYYDDKPDFESADLVEVVAGVETERIDAALTLQEPPAPSGIDAAVETLTVENVPLRTDAVTAPGTGTLRRITVEIANVGTAGIRHASVDVIACAVTTFRCRFIGFEDVRRLAPGERSTHSFRWNAFGMVGDVEVSAVVSAPGDRHERNDRKTVEHYAVVGGTGFGVDLFCPFFFGPCPG